MKRRPLWKVCIATAAEAEEAVSELVAKAFGQAVTSYRDAETGQTSVTTYLYERPSPSGSWHEQLREGLKRIRQCGSSVAPGRILLSRVRWEDWAESWKRHFPARYPSVMTLS